MSAIGRCSLASRSLRSCAGSLAAPLPTRQQRHRRCCAIAAMQQQQQQPQPPATANGHPPVRLVLVVAVALIDSQQRVLLAQRPPGKAMEGLWEFPGGKVDLGETPEAALVRELQEELSIQVSPRDLQPLTFASHTYDTFHLLMPLYVCRRWCGEPHGAEGQALSWVTQRQIRDYPMPAADIPLVAPVLAAMAAPRVPA